MPLDAVDRKILTLLQDNARISNAEISRQIGMVPSGTLERIRKLEETGLIRGYEVKLDPAQVEQSLLAFIFVRAEERPAQHETADRLASLEEIQEIHHVAGEDCYLLKVRSPNTEALGRFLREKLGAIETIRSTRSTIVLHTIKETSRLPLPAAPSVAQGGAA